MKKSLTVYHFMPEEASCENCEFYKDGRCEKYNIASDPEALCKQYAEKK